METSKEYISTRKRSHKSKNIEGPLNEGFERNLVSLKNKIIGVYYNSSNNEIICNPLQLSDWIKESDDRIAKISVNSFSFVPRKMTDNVNEKLIDIDSVPENIRSQLNQRHIDVIEEVPEKKTKLTLSVGSVSKMASLNKLDSNISDNIRNEDTIGTTEVTIDKISAPKVATAKSKKLKLKIKQNNFVEHTSHYKWKEADMSQFIPITMVHNTSNDNDNDKINVKLFDHQLETATSCHMQRLHALTKDKQVIEEIKSELKPVCGFHCGFDVNGDRRSVFECDYCLSLWHYECVACFKVEVFVNLNMYACHNCTIFQNKVLQSKSPSLFCNTESLFKIEYQPETRPITSIESIYKLCKLQWITDYLKMGNNTPVPTNSNIADITDNISNTDVNVSNNNNNVDNRNTDNNNSTVALTSNNVTPNLSNDGTTLKVPSNYKWKKYYSFSIKSEMIQTEVDSEILKIKYNQDDITLLAEIFTAPESFLYHNNRSYPVIQHRVVVNNAELLVPVKINFRAPINRLYPFPNSSFYIYDKGQQTATNIRNMRILVESMKSSFARANLFQPTAAASNQVPQIPPGQIQLSMPSTTVNQLMNQHVVAPPSSSPVINLANPSSGPRINVGTILTAPLLTGMWPSTGPSIMASVTFNQQQPHQLAQQLNSSQVVPEIMNVQSLSAPSTTTVSGQINRKALSYLRNHIYSLSNLPYPVLKKILMVPNLKLYDHKNIRQVNRMFRELINSIYYEERNNIVIQQKPSAWEQSNIIDYMEIDDDDDDSCEVIIFDSEIPMKTSNILSIDHFEKFEYLIEYSNNNSIQSFNRLVKSKEQDGTCDAINEISIIIDELFDKADPKNYLNNLDLNYIFKTFKRTKQFVLKNLSKNRFYMKMLLDETLEAENLQTFKMSGISNEYDLKFNYAIIPSLITIMTDDNQLITKYLAPYPYLFLTTFDIKSDTVDTNELAEMILEINKHRVGSPDDAAVKLVSRLGFS